MSAKIAPENVSVGVTLASRAAPKPVPTSRPIEDAGIISADSNPSKNRAFGRKISDGNKAEPGTRPPGKDPSVLPQSLFDAALISSEYKPQTRQEFKPPQPSESVSSLALTAVESSAEKSAAQTAPTDAQTAASSDTGEVSKRIAPETNEWVARLSA